MTTHDNAQTESRRPPTVIQMVVFHTFATGCMGALWIVTMYGLYALIDPAQLGAGSILVAFVAMSGTMFVAGCLMGFVLSPALIVLTKRKRLTHMSMAVYLPTLTVMAGASFVPTIAIALQYWGPHMTVAVPCTVAGLLIGFALIAQRTLPNRSVNTLYCPQCGYDRRGLNDRACPECGDTSTIDAQSLGA